MGGERDAGRRRRPTLLPPSAWGPQGWNWLHVAAINYPLEPTPADARAASRRIWSFVQGLPCETCRRHAMSHVLRHPPNLADTYTMQAWAWSFHNAVNARLGKRQLSYEEYQALYADELCTASWSAGGRYGGPPLGPRPGGRGGR